MGHGQKSPADERGAITAERGRVPGAFEVAEDFEINQGLAEREYSKAASLR